jgi:Fe-Mn family superoxide dismutase
VFNNAAQSWNHAFYWRSLRPNGGGEPPARLKKMMEGAFGSVELCKKGAGQSGGDAIWERLGVAGSKW